MTQLASSNFVYYSFVSLFLISCKLVFEPPFSLNSLRRHPLSSCFCLGVGFGSGVLYQSIGWLQGFFLKNSLPGKVEILPYPLISFPRLNLVCRVYDVKRLNSLVSMCNPIPSGGGILYISRAAALVFRDMLLL